MVEKENKNDNKMCSVIVCLNREVLRCL